MPSFSSNIDITSGGTYAMDITNGESSAKVATDINGKFQSIQTLLQNQLPEVWTGSSLPDSLPNGKLIVFGSDLYYGYNNKPQIIESEVDLSNYITQSTLTSTLSSYITSSTLTSRLSSYVTTSTLDSRLNNLDIPVVGRLTTFNKPVNVGFKPTVVFAWSVDDNMFDSGTSYRLWGVFVSNTTVLYTQNNNAINVGLMRSYLTSTGFDANGVGIRVPAIYIAYR